MCVHEIFIKLTYEKVGNKTVPMLFHSSLVLQEELVHLHLWI